ncbi:hypothetical protein BC830DRAFT_22131 [Chytriomyces sp. MP71]|nr:hypothetical protein BC830DRAFT_22131 [Chytriomyces sp. MP71]
MGFPANARCVRLCVIVWVLSIKFSFLVTTLVYFSGWYVMHCLPVNPTLLHCQDTLQNSLVTISSCDIRLPKPHDTFDRCHCIHATPKSILSSFRPCL